MSRKPGLFGKRRMLEIQKRRAAINAAIDNAVIKPDYVEELERLPNAVRDRMLHGDWSTQMLTRSAGYKPKLYAFSNPSSRESPFQKLYEGAYTKPKKAPVIVYKRRRKVEICK